MKTMTWMLLAGVLGAPGCVVVYAPSAERAALYSHDQVATNMVINQAIDPRVANELTGAVGAQVKGNNVLSPSTKLEAKGLR